ncbi:MAG: PLP-dependent aspartate aminotransferase family protein, partial [Thermoanaerobaculia bacterium]|nr:PLP-dependent aspartate aminotransferase family protein [Thermoanaerobaculia bacterium]
MGDGSRPATRAVTAGEETEPPRPPATPAVYQTAPFLFSSTRELEEAFAGEGDHGLYSRYSSPNSEAVEAKIATLEEAEGAVAFSSGMSAIASVLSSLLRSGSHLVVARELYGGTLAWLEHLRERQPEIGTERVALDRLRERLRECPGPDLVWVESPTNPRLRCIDLSNLATGCREAGAKLAVDNTFATPVLQRPLSLGADLVVHSATKYLGGHSDVTAGVVAGRRGLLEPIRRHRRLGGAVLDPHAAFLLNRGIKTLFLRVERQSASASRLAETLGEHGAVLRVFYPGLDPLGRRQMRAGGGMLSFEVRDGETAAAVVDHLRRFRIL